MTQPMPTHLLLSTGTSRTHAREQAVATNSHLALAAADQHASLRTHPALWHSAGDQARLPTELFAGSCICFKVLCLFANCNQLPTSACSSNTNKDKFPLEAVD